MRSTIVVLFLLSSVIAVAQKPGGASYAKGKALYDEDKYAEAIPNFEQSLKINARNDDALYYLGLCYYYSDQTAKAIPVFENLEKVNPDYWAWFYYEWGAAYFELRRFDEAITAFEKFEAKFSNRPTQTAYHHKAQYKLQYAKAQKALLEAKSLMKEPVRLPSNINSPQGDYAPLLDPTGTRLYFTSKRLGGMAKDEVGKEEGDEDAYVIEKNGDSWSEPKLLPEPINTPQNEGADFISADGQMMGFTSSRDGGVGNADIYISTLEGSQWSKPVNMGNVVNSEEWDANSTISYDNNRIIFVSKRAGTYGAADLYMTERNILGQWGPAVNMGGILNTPFTEHSPFLSQDGKTLYFSSNGHPGYGGNDLFKSVLENGKWSLPVNLGRPLNTEGDDDFFTIGGSGEKGYFSSDRGGKASDLFEIDIPEEMRPQPTVVVEGVVTNEKTKSLVGAYVMVEDLNNGELIAVNKSNSATGKYLVVLPAGKTYGVSANKEGFFFHSELFDVPSTAKFRTIRKDISLRPIEKGAKVVLNNIFFETGKASLSPQSRVEMEKAVDLMKANPSMIIEVGGHTDNVGEDASNMKLSHERAKLVREYLVNAGIVSSRVQAKGYGESNPIASNDTDDGRKANRRTEFIILEF